MTAVSHPEHIRQMADLGDPLAIAALEGQTITQEMYRRAWEESAKYAHKLELENESLEKRRLYWWRLACRRLGVLHDVIRVQSHLESFILTELAKDV